jgi:hypothetical protein
VQKGASWLGSMPAWHGANVWHVAGIRLRSG